MKANPNQVARDHLLRARQNIGRAIRNMEHAAALLDDPLHSAVANWIEQGEYLTRRLGNGLQLLRVRGDE